MVSHNVDDALQIAPRTLVAEGNIAYDGDTPIPITGQSAASALLSITTAANN